MRIRRRRRAELSPIETGSVIHYALQMLISKYRDTPLSSIPRAQLQREIDRILEEYLEQFMGGMEEKTARFPLPLPPPETHGAAADCTPGAGV